MTHFTSFLLLVIISLQQTYAKEFTPIPENVMALQKVEEFLLPKLDAFIVSREDHLKELEKMISQTADVKGLQASDGVEGYLGTPLNQYSIIKRFIDDWGTLEDLLESDTSSFDLFSQIMEVRNSIPHPDELKKALLDLEKTSDIDPEKYQVFLE